MKKTLKLLAVIALICSAFAAKAQNEGIVFTLMPQIPYSNYFNPGVRVPYKGFLGIGISNVSVSYYNSSIKASNLYGVNEAGEDVIDADKFIKSLDAQDNILNFNFSLDILNVGFRWKKMFFSLDWRYRMGTDIRYSRDFLGFFILGNGHYLGEDNPCDFNVDIDAMAFSEYGLGFQYDVNEKLTVGVRPKLLDGIVNIVVNNERTKIYTDADTYAMTADVNLDVKVASIVKADIYRIGDITNIFDSIGKGDGMNINHNYGLGVDFGASYVANEHWGVAAGVYDLGYIKWKNPKVKNSDKEDVVLNDAVFTDLDEVYSLKLDYKSMLDELVDEVWGNDSLRDGSSYTTYLKTRLMAQGYYQINPMLRFTGIGQLYTYKGKAKPSFTLAYSGVFFNHLNLALSYTMSNYTGSALGTGLGFHFGPFNFYMVSDNMLAIFKTSSTIEEYATAYKTAGVRLGVIWTLGKYQKSNPITDKKKIDNDMEVEKKVDTEAIDKEKEEFEKQQQNQ